MSHCSTLFTLKITSIQYLVNDKLNINNLPIFKKVVLYSCGDRCGYQPQSRQKTGPSGQSAKKRTKLGGTAIGLAPTKNDFSLFVGAILIY
jgi:hypothetical protein